MTSVGLAASGAGGGRCGRFGAAAIDYLRPDLPPGLRRVVMPVVDASPAALRGYGRLVDDPAECEVEIVRWPQRGTPADRRRHRRPGRHDRGRLRQRMAGRHPVRPQRRRRRPLHPRLRRAARGRAHRPRRARRAGSCCGTRTTTPTAASCSSRSTRGRSSCRSRCPATTSRPSASSAFASTAAQGLYIHPDIWHEGVFGLAGTQRFFDKQGAVHARVSVDFAREFGCLLEAPIAAGEGAGAPG